MRYEIAIVAAPWCVGVICNQHYIDIQAPAIPLCPWVSPACRDMRIEGSPRILTEGARSRYLNKTIIINNIFNKKVLI